MAPYLTRMHHKLAYIEGSNGICNVGSDLPKLHVLGAYTGHLFVEIVFWFRKNVLFELSTVVFGVTKPLFAAVSDKKV